MDAWLSLEVDKAVDEKKVSRRLTCLIRKWFVWRDFCRHLRPPECVPPHLLIKLLFAFTFVQVISFFSTIAGVQDAVK